MSINEDHYILLKLTSFLKTIVRNVTSWLWLNLGGGGVTCDQGDQRHAATGHWSLVGTRVIIRMGQPDLASVARCRSTCGEFSGDMACINLSWRHLLKRKTKLRKNEDYIYLQWHFMTSNNTGNNDSHSVEHLPDIRSAETEDKVPDPESSIFSDIRTWLASQPDHFCAEIYCDCCDPSLDPHYSGVSTSFSSPPSSPRIPNITHNTPAEDTPHLENITRNLNRRQDSVSSVTTSTLSEFSSVTTSSCYTSVDEQDESNYSLQIRRKSKSLFRSKRVMI